MTALKIAWFEYRRRIRSKWFIIGTFGMPLLILGFSLLSGYLAGPGADVETKHYGLIDETGIFGPQLVYQVEKRFEGEKKRPFDLILARGNSATLQPEFESMVAERALDGYFLILQDFNANPQARFHARSSTNFRLAETVEAELQDILVHSRAESMDLGQEVLDTLFVNVSVDHYALGADVETEVEQLAAEFIGPFIIMMLLFFGIFTGGQLLLRAVLEERSSRVIEVLLSSVSYESLMGGKILGLGLLGLTQSAIYFIFGAIGSAQFGLTLITADLVILYLVYFVLGYLFYASLYIGTGALFDSEQEAQQAIQIMSFIAVIPMLLGTVLIENPNSTLVNVLSYIPPMTPFFMIVKVSLDETSLFQILTTIALLSVSVLGAIKIAAKLFKTGILLYGKRVTLPEILKWIRA